MFHCLIAAGLSLLCFSISYAQSSSTLMGARAGGLGYASSCITDEWAVFNNIAGLAKVDKSSVAFTYDSQPTFKPFDRIAAVFTLPLNFGTVGTGVYRFGDELYSEHVIAVGFSNSFGLASLGLKVNYIQYNAEGFGSKGVFALSFGGIAKLTEQISIGAHIINLNQPSISPENERLPTLLIIGGGFQLTPAAFVTTELEKDLGYRVKWKTGVEYLLYKKFTVRTGFNLNPASAFFGLGFQTRKFKLDYAYQHNFSIGSRHQATVAYKFKTQQ